MTLSVIIPCYNAEKTLENTVSSLFLQQNVNFDWEILAVDDGSNDNTPRLLEELKNTAEEKGLLFRYLLFENGGVGENRNRGLQYAEGEYLLFLDADDLLLPTALSEAMTAVREKDLSLLLFDSHYLYCDGREEPLEAISLPEGHLSPEEYAISLPAPWNKIIKKSLFEQNGLRFEKNMLYEDLALIPALARGLKKSDIYYLKKSLHRYYQSENSIMRSPWSEKKMDLLRALKALKKNMNGCFLAETEYLFYLHLYRGFAWTCWEAGKTDAIVKAGALMRETFPHWQKNPLVRKNATRKERLTAHLFYGEHFSILRLWKGNNV